MGRPRRTARSMALPSNLYQNGNYWQWRHPKTKRKISLGRLTRRQAIAVAIDLNNKYLANEVANKTEYVFGNRTTFSGFLDQWKTQWLDKALESGILAKNTVRRKMSDLRFAKEAWGEMYLKDITLLDLTKKLEETTYDKYVGMRFFLKQVFNYAVARGEIPENPALKILNAKEDARLRVKERSRLSKDLFDKVISYIILENQKHVGKRNSRFNYLWLKDLMLMQLYTAAGEHEVCNMTVDQINADNVWVFFREKTKKKAIDPCTIQLSDKAMEIVAKAKNGRVFNTFDEVRGYRRITPQYYATRFNQVIKKIIQPCDLINGCTKNPSPHEIRALSARLNYNADLSLEEVSKLMGHKSLEITRHYLRGHNLYSDINAIRTGDFYGK